MTTRKTYFNDLADKWDKTYLTSELQKFLTGFVPKFGLEEGDNVLDVGTGTGLLIPFLLKAVGPSGHVTAIDFAENMVEICKSKYGKIQNVSVVRQQVEELDLPSESFDAVVCFGVFPHIEDKKQALSRISRVLKTGGWLIIAHALSSREIREHHNNASTIVAADKLPALKEMERLLKYHGFGKIIVTDKPGQYLNRSLKMPPC